MQKVRKPGHSLEFADDTFADLCQLYANCILCLDTTAEHQFLECRPASWIAGRDLNPLGNAAGLWFGMPAA
jgi:hypothetical protein